MSKHIVPTLPSGVKFVVTDKTDPRNLEMLKAAMQSAKIGFAKVEERGK